MDRFLCATNSGGNLGSDVAIDVEAIMLNGVSRIHSTHSYVSLRKTVNSNREYVRL